jgi:SP family sugar:H+ symporter-like MFS transporter
MRLSMRRDNGEAAHDNGTAETFGKDRDTPRDTDMSSDALDSASEISEKQAGVKRIEAVSKSWTKSSLIIAYVT